MPAKSGFEQIGEMVILTARTIGAAVRPPYPYGEELVDQFLFVLKLSWFPMTISIFALCFGGVGLQASGILDLFGALDRLGGIFVVTAIRFIGPLPSGSPSNRSLRSRRRRARAPAAVRAGSGSWRSMPKRFPIAMALRFVERWPLAALCAEPCAAPIGTRAKPAHANLQAFRRHSDDA